MTGHMNGNGDLPSLPEGKTEMELVAEATQRVQAQIKSVTPIVKTAATVMVQGLRMSTANIDLLTLLSVIATEVGTACALSVTGDLGVMLQVRKGLQESFADGVRKAPISTPAPTNVPPNLRG